MPFGLWVVLQTILAILSILSALTVRMPNRLGWLQATVFVSLFIGTCALFVLAYLPGWRYTSNDQKFLNTWWIIVLALIIEVGLYLLVFHFANPDRPNYEQRLNASRNARFAKNRRQLEEREMREAAERNPDYRR